MVGSDDLKDVMGNAGEAASQALAAILQTQYLRYLIIASWAVGLGLTVGWQISLVWFVATAAAGAIRGVVERSINFEADTRSSWGLIFPAVATVTTGVWAAAPLVAWFSGAHFGPALAITLLICGYVLVFAQLRNSPGQALLISSPYAAAAVVIIVSLWGGELFWPFLSLVPIVGGSLFVLVVMTVIRERRIQNFQTHQAHLIAELEEARDKAAAANEAKSSFLGVISHELRTPMNGVLGAAQLLSATRLEAQQRDYLSIIRNSGDSLMSLLNDILDMTKIEAGRMDFESIDIDMEDMHQRITAPFKAQAETKGLTLLATFEGDMPAVVRGDPLRVGQVIQNLLSNAIKFTDVGGEVRYTVRSRRLAERRVAFEFEVADTGAGIADEDLSLLFQPFSQVDASSTRRYGGTGLGLTISRRLATIMGGDILVSSVKGVGSVFTFCVEAEVVDWSLRQAAEAIDADVANGSSLKVLVVEDHPVNRMILEAWMASAGHVTVTAENGEQALKVCDVEGFDLIIMDVNMPVMDGLTATRRLRELAGPNQQAPVVVLSASARNEDQEAGLAAGADAYLTKPIDFTALVRMMSEASTGRRALRAFNDARAKDMVA